jgi:hypothetical protein
MYLWGKYVVFRLFASPFSIYKEKRLSMEEQQIQSFVYTVLQDEKLRRELACDPDAVIMREGFSPRLASVIRKLVPSLGIDQIPPLLEGFWV